MKCNLTVLLLMKLKSKNIGTNVIVLYVKNEARTDKLTLKNRRILLNLKLENARSEELKARSKFDAKMKYLSKRWGHYVNIMTQFKVIMQRETEIAWKYGHDKMNRKIKFLSNKFSRTCVVNDVWENIVLSDEILKDKFKDPEVKL